MEQLCEEIFKNLNIYEKNSAKYTKCLGRGIEILISSKPEEKVRQVLLYFLINESGLFPNQIHLKVEYNNLDIAIYQNGVDNNFKPFHPPMAIVEVKREEENLLNHENQLWQYLKENRVKIGILFNGNETIGYQRNEDGDFVKNCLISVKDISKLILQAASQIEDDYSDFIKAKNGDIESFIYLIGKYGKHTLHKVTFTLNSPCPSITGCCFSYDEHYIYYDLYAKYSQNKRLYFKRCDFGKLISIVY